MAADFDEFPVYDPITRMDSNRLSNKWQSAMATFHQTLIGYLTQNGIILPNITLEQRNAIQSPQNGQMIYNTTDDVPQIFKKSSGTSGLWHNITLT